jgi:hypothetical protein
MLKARIPPLNSKQYRQLEEALARKYKADYEKAARVSAYRMMLIVLYNLRFDFKFKKRLNDFFEAICENNTDVNKWKKSDVMASVMLKRLEESGCDFNGAFDELIAYEEEEYKKNRDEEAEKRGAGK